MSFVTTEQHHRIDSTLPIDPESLQTPYVMIDLARTKRNIHHMTTTLQNISPQVTLRPHIKTHKLPQLAKMQLAAGAIGITCAKLAEAEVMAAAGINDIFIGYPLIGKLRLQRAAKLLQAGVRLIVAVDSLEGAQQLSRAASIHHVTFEIRLEIETGLRRTGVTQEQVVALALQIATLKGIHITGIFTYKGAVLAEKPTTDLAAAGKEESDIMIKVAAALREAGIAIQDISVGSTPSALHAASTEGVTEVRPGTYIFYDRMQAAYGVCQLEDCSALLWATIVSRPAPDRIIIDTGSKSLAADIQPQQDQLFLHGFGHIVGDADAIIERMNEEHGMVTVRPEATYAIGDRISIIPNHICTTINLHNFVYVKDEDGKLYQWNVAARGLVY
ncbi:alanine racemase [Paenibacillus yanchengensis]|uniref:Alanine racemase n=1 Tax=Paenibacillus yanchengensis TaxID=2035833 RepID=A0ABW4YIT3_9BACL